MISNCLVHAQDLPERTVYDATATDVDTIRIRFKGYSEKGRVLRTQDILTRLQSVDTSALSIYEKGRKLQKTGVAIVIAGGGIAVVGNIMTLKSAMDEMFASGSSREVNYTPGYVITGLGLGMVVAGVVNVFIGKRRKNEAIGLYNHTLKASSSRTSFYV
ncbi:MAG TPA: hypothetical protein VGN64_12535, partial [Dyadobacter sp.]|nr:hypothetical protein [Dyadobacter sp.]